MSDPTTPEEWQNAVDAADYLLLIEAAEQYGLISGAGDVNADRCVEILTRGAQLGIFPTAPERRRDMIAWWLRSEREALRLTQAEVGRLIGMSAPWIGQIERKAIALDDTAVTRLREAFAAVRKERR